MLVGEVEQADLDGGPQVVGCSLVEDELAVVGAAIGELAVEVELDVRRETEIEREERADTR